MANRDDEVKQAIGAVARLGGFTIKRVATTDDLKDRTLTITLTRVSDGHVQDRFAFEEETDFVAQVNQRGEVESLNGRGPLNPSDYTEKDETAQAADPDEVVQGAPIEASTEEKTGEATGEPREGIEVEAGEVVELSSKKRR